MWKQRYSKMLGKEDRSSSTTTVDSRPGGQEYHDPRGRMSRDGNSKDLNRDLPAIPLEYDTLNSARDARPISTAPTASSIYSKRSPEFGYDFDDDAHVQPLFSGSSQPSYSAPPAGEENSNDSIAGESPDWQHQEVNEPPQQIHRPQKASASPLTERAHKAGVHGLGLDTSGARMPWTGASGSAALMTPIAASNASVVDSEVSPVESQAPTHHFNRRDSQISTVSGFSDFTEERQKSLKKSDRVAADTLLRKPTWNVSRRIAEFQKQNANKLKANNPNFTPDKIAQQRLDQFDENGELIVFAAAGPKAPDKISAPRIDQFSAATKIPGPVKKKPVPPRMESFSVTSTSPRNDGSNHRNTSAGSIEAESANRQPYDSNIPVPSHNAAPVPDWDDIPSYPSTIRDRSITPPSRDLQTPAQSIGHVSIPEPFTHKDEVGVSQPQHGSHDTALIMKQATTDDETSTFGSLTPPAEHPEFYQPRAELGAPITAIIEEPELEEEVKQEQEEEEKVEAACILPVKKEVLPETSTLEKEQLEEEVAREDVVPVPDPNADASRLGVPSLGQQAAKLKWSPTMSEQQHFTPELTSEQRAFSTVPSSLPHVLPPDRVASVSPESFTYPLKPQQVEPEVYSEVSNDGPASPEVEYTSLQPISPIPERPPPPVSRFSCTTRAESHETTPVTPQSSKAFDANVHPTIETLSQPPAVIESPSRSPLHTTAELAQQQQQHNNTHKQTVVSKFSWTTIKTHSSPISEAVIHVNPAGQGYDDSRLRPSTAADSIMSRPHPFAKYKDESRRNTPSPKPSISTLGEVADIQRPITANGILSNEPEPISPPLADPAAQTRSATVPPKTPPQPQLVKRKPTPASVGKRSSGMTGKELPLSPQALASIDIITEIQAKLADLELKRINLNKLIETSRAKELKPNARNPLVHDLARRRRDAERLAELESEVAIVKQEEYELGLRLHMAWKRREQEAPTTLWVRRVTS